MSASEWVEPLDESDSGGMLRGDEVAQLARGVADLAKAGLPLPGGLRALGLEVESRRLKSALFDLARRVEGGEALDDAIAAQGDRFPAHLSRLVEAGVKSGRLAEVLGQFVGFYNVGADLRRRLVVSLAYPIMLLVAGLAVFAYISIFLVPDFAAIFKDFGIELPAMTRRMFVLARIVRVESWEAPATILGGLAFGLLIFRFVLGPADRQRLISGMPLFGPLWRMTSLAEFSHLLALMIETSVPLPDALPLAGDGVGDADLARTCRKLAREVEAGRSLAEAVDESGQFPAALGQLLGWAKGKRALPEALHLAGEMFEARARAHGRFVSVVVSMLVGLSVISIVVFVQLALLFPLVSLISKLSG